MRTKRIIKEVIVVPPSVDLDGFMSQCQVLGYSRDYCIDWAKTHGGKSEEIRDYESKKCTVERSTRPAAHVT